MELPWADAISKFHSISSLATEAAKDDQRTKNHEIGEEESVKAEAVSVESGKYRKRGLVRAGRVVKGRE